jgi:CubicO group peptidase (beta-lactamase class C family)
MNSALRDLGRLGLLVMNKGMAFDQEVIPAEFIKDLHTQPGDPYWPYESALEDQPYYRSFWWGEGNKERDLSGVGIHGQSLRVASEVGIVIALYSSWPRADGDNNDQYWDKNSELLSIITNKFR